MIWNGLDGTGTAKGFIQEGQISSIFTKWNEPHEISERRTEILRCVPGLSAIFRNRFRFVQRQAM
jgi:hypothetical protein